MTSYRFRRRVPLPMTRDCFRSTGVPRDIVSDCGPGFTGGNFREAVRYIRHGKDETCDATGSNPLIR